jgi:hypothetical protein
MPLRTAAGILAILLLVGCASTRNNASAWRSAALATVAADVAITSAALNRGQANEKNPALGQQPGRILAINVAVLGACWWLSKDWSPQQQAKLWRWLTIIRVPAVAWNVQEARKR